MNDIPPVYRAPINPDQEHLNLIAIFHYVLSGLSVLYIPFLFIHYSMMSTMMTTMMNSPKMREQMQEQGSTVDPAAFLHIFVWFYIFMGAWGLVSLILNISSGICIQRRQSRLFSLIVAGFNCINLPLGTVLGVFTIILLIRPSIIALYQQSAPR